MKIIYIAGMVHSGSTYLARVLNQHSEIFSPGEFEYLHERVENSFRSCSCTTNSEGRVKDSCEFWQELMEPLLDEIDVERTARITLNRNKEWWQALYQENFSKVDPEFEHGNRLLFKRISEFTDSSVLVDASKGPWRLIPLRQVFGDDLYVLHVVKHPLNQLVSHVNRGHNFYRSAFMKYIRRNLIYSWKFGASSNYHRLRFEEFVDQPEKHLVELFDWLGLNYQDPYDKEQEKYHHLSGSAAAASGSLPKPDPERVNKDEPDWSSLRWAIIKLLRKLY